MGWRKLGSDIAVTYSAGDRFGVRMQSDGSLEVYRNSQPVGAYSAASWPYSTSGGYIGLFMSNASGARLDDFGGGSVSGSAPPQPPPQPRRLVLPRRPQRRRAPQFPERRPRRRRRAFIHPPACWTTLIAPTV
ncbi:MAG: hypothetical protein IPK16_05935 [Anaerolineales bacterium]|nr:hypothetical protein [Anaerolineales bacterium]